jgi:hypothetical protein
VVRNARPPPVRRRGIIPTSPPLESGPGHAPARPFVHRDPPRPQACPRHHQPWGRRRTDHRRAIGSANPVDSGWLVHALGRPTQAQFVAVRALGFTTESFIALPDLVVEAELYRGPLAEFGQRLESGIAPRSTFFTRADIDSGGPGTVRRVLERRGLSGRCSLARANVAFRWPRASAGNTVWTRCRAAGSARWKCTGRPAPSRPRSPARDRQRVHGDYLDPTVNRTRWPNERGAERRSPLAADRERGLRE